MKRHIGTPRYGADPENFAGMTETQAELALWACMGGDMDDEFYALAEKYIAGHSGEDGEMGDADGNPEEVVASLGSDFADWAVKERPEIEQWVREAAVGDSTLGSLLDRLEKFVDGGLYEGAPAWDIKLYGNFVDGRDRDPLDAVKPEDPAFAGLWEEARGYATRRACEEAWHATVSSCSSGCVSFLQLGRSGGHAVLALDGKEMAIPLDKHSGARTRAAAFAVQNWGDLDDVSFAVEQMDKAVANKFGIVAEALGELCEDAVEAWKRGEEYFDVAPAPRQESANAPS